jgi:hypothetical protein
MTPPPRSPAQISRSNFKKNLKICSDHEACQRLPKSPLGPSSIAEATPALDPIISNLSSTFNHCNSNVTSLDTPLLNRRRHHRAQLLRPCHVGRRLPQHQCLPHPQCYPPPTPHHRLQHPSSLLLPPQVSQFPPTDKDFKEDLHYFLHILRCPINSPAPPSRPLARCIPGRRSYPSCTGSPSRPTSLRCHLFCPIQ